MVLYLVYSLLFSPLHSRIYFLHLIFDCFVIIEGIVAVPGLGSDALPCSVIGALR